MPINRPVAVVAALALIMCVAVLSTLRSIENRVSAALDNQHLLNTELRAVMVKNGIRSVELADAHRYLALGKESSAESDETTTVAPSARGKITTNKRPPPHAEYIDPAAKSTTGTEGTGRHDAAEGVSRPPSQGAGGAGAGSSSGAKSDAAPSPQHHADPIIEEAPPVAENVGPPRDRDGRVIIAPEDRQDTDADEDEAAGSDGAHEDAGRLTPAPPPPRPALPTLPDGKEWPEGDPNFGFKPDGNLPTIGVVTLNAQAGAGRGIGLARKSAWIHRMSFTNKQAYCKRWGYDLIIEDNTIIDTSRDVAWSKIPIFKKWLPKYQWLLWIDMDAFFMRFDLPITDMIDNNHDLIIAKDWHGINFGVFLIRNSPWAFHLLDKMWNSPRQWWKPWEEQSALMSLTNPRKNPSHAEKLLQHIRFPRQREINAYGAEFAYGNLQALYRAGDRIVHFPNCKAIRTCRNTIESFYKQMLADNGVEDLDPNEVPASMFPDPPVPGSKAPPPPVPTAEGDSNT